MNEKLFELLVESGVLHAMKHTDIAIDKEIEKFAELIVRECANVCRDDGRWFQEQDDKLEEGVAYALCYKIKQHFGVEE